MTRDEAPTPARVGTVLTPTEAADRLGIGAAMLRRHAATYEAAFGPLPRDQRGARAYPITAVQRLQHATEAYRAGAAPSVADALDELRHGRTPSEPPALPEGQDRTLALLLTEVQAAQASRDRLTEHVATLTGLLQGDGSDTVATLQARVIALQDEVRDLERRNAALLTALRDRDQADTEPERPWWTRILGT